MSRIEFAIRQGVARKGIALAAYLPVGFPSVAGSVEIVRAMVEAGADVVELGVPFSDPLADGVTIQRAGQHALALGVDVGVCLDAARQLARQAAAPALLMGYYNPFLRYGLERLCADAADAGVAGLIVPDLPPDEADPLLTAARAHQIDVVFLLSPNSTDARVRLVGERSSGFVYCTALTGVTGARSTLGDDVASMVARVRQRTQLPVCVGFGISRPEHVARLTGVADGAIVGSAIVDRIEAALASGTDPASAAAELVASLRVR